MEFPNIRAEMTRHSETNKDIGKILNISSNSVSFKLNGRRQFTLDEIHKLAIHYDCSIDYLVGFVLPNNTVAGRSCDSA